MKIGLIVLTTFLIVSCTRSQCADGWSTFVLEISGVAKGGEVSVGFIAAPEGCVSVTTSEGDKAEQISEKLGKALKASLWKTLEIKGNKIFLINMTNTFLFCRIKDKGLASSPKVLNASASIDQVKKVINPSWELPTPNPTLISVFRNGVQMTIVWRGSKGCADDTESSLKSGEVKYRIVAYDEKGRPSDIVEINDRFP